METEKGKKYRLEHPDRIKAYAHKQYLKRKEKGFYKDFYISKNTPAIKKHHCQNCGRLTINRFNCPGCLHELTVGVSEQYDNFIYDIVS